MKLKIDIVGHDSKRTEVLDVAPGGAKFKEILDTLDIDAKNKDLSVLGKPATLETMVTPADVLAAKDKGVSVLSISARPQGS